MNWKNKWHNVEEGKPFYPRSSFRNKLIIVTYTILLLIYSGLIALGTFIVFMSSLDEDPSDEFLSFLRNAGPSFLLGYILILIVLIPVVFLLADYYTNFMEFTIDETEIIIKKGLINKEIKHVPFRTITNVSSRYGPYDRILGIGTVEIETAGKSGQQSGPEAKIEGISNFYEVRDYILDKLRQFRSVYATTTEVEYPSPEHFPSTDYEVQKEMLEELREIKKLLSK